MRDSTGWSRSTSVMTSILCDTTRPVKECTWATVTTKRAIAVVDATSNQRLPELGARPESFQLEKSGPNMYVNLPALKEIDLINRATGKISRWSLRLGSNFPMAIDEANGRLFVVTPVPARLVVFDTKSGRLLVSRFQSCGSSARGPGRGDLVVYSAGLEKQGPTKHDG
jgi:hypothetical protein